MKPYYLLIAALVFYTCLPSVPIILGSVANHPAVYLGLCLMDCAIVAALGFKAFLSAWSTNDA